MQRFRFPLAVLLTSIGLVALLVLAAGWLVGNALASGFGYGLGAAHWGPGAGAGFDLPQEVSGLRDVPADQRFAHFRGVQVSLTDKDNHPLTLTVTPGTVNAVSPNSLTMTTNDGASRTFGIDSSTAIRGRTTLAQGDKVVVTTLNSSGTAMAVIAGDPSGFHPGPRGPWGH
jgi:hypothetical protein